MKESDGTIGCRQANLEQQLQDKEKQVNDKRERKKMKNGACISSKE